MKRYQLVLLYPILFALLSGCGADADAYLQVSGEMARQNSSISAASSDGEAVSGKTAYSGEKKELSGSLTVKAFWDDQIDVYVKDFTGLHPGVSVELVAGREKMLSFDDYITQTSVELMSGNSADIIETDGMCVPRLAGSGIFCDLYPFMDSDPDFRREDYYTNLFEAKEYEGRLYSLPCAFSYNMLYASKPLLEKTGLGLPQTLNYKQMMDIHQIVTEKTGEAPKLRPGLTPYTFFYYEFPEYYDVAAASASFLSPKFIEYLRLTKQNIPVLEESDLTRVGTDDSFLNKDYLFCNFDVTGGVDIFNFLYDFQNIQEPVPMVSTSGKAYFRTMRDYSIAASSSNQQLAWEFLKFYVSEKEIPTDIHSEYAEKYAKKYNVFVPVNKKNFINSCRFAYQYYLPMAEKENLKTGELKAAVDEAIERMHGWNQQRSHEEAEGEIYGALSGDLSLYYEQNLLTPEETAGKLQNRMTIFLKE